MDYRGDTWNRDPFEDPESIAVLAGSGCYRSHGNRAGRTDEEYLQEAIVGHKHLSVIEHITINFSVMSLPRSTQLELVRHRVGVAYSFLSQRFTDDFTEFIVPPLLRMPEHEEAKQVFMAHCISTFNIYQTLIESTTAETTTGERTLRRKRVKESSRAVLNNAVGSDGVVSLNGRELRHIIELRSDPHAEAGIREFAFALYAAAKEVVPKILQDAVEVDVGWGAPQITFAAS